MHYNFFYWRSSVKIKLTYLSQSFMYFGGQICKSFASYILQNFQFSIVTNSEKKNFTSLPRTTKISKWEVAHVKEGFFMLLQRLTQL